MTSTQLKKYYVNYYILQIKYLKISLKKKRPDPETQVLDSKFSALYIM